MKKIVAIAFWALGLVFCYLIYRSVTGPTEFSKVKTERYTEVTKKPKDIRAAQNAYLRINGKYAGNFDRLTNFIENAQFTITPQHDTSWAAFGRTFNIEVIHQGVRTDTLDYVGVKDSSFKDPNRYKTLRCVPKFTKDEAPLLFTMKTSEMKDKDNAVSSVSEVYVSKRGVLKGLDKDLVDKEVVKDSVDDMGGKNIKVDSLEETTINDNWPTSYDAKIAKQQ